MGDVILKTQVRLPGLVVDKKTVGGNRIVQLAQTDCITNVDVYAHAQNSFILIDDIGREIYINLPRSKADTSKKDYVLKASGISDIKKLNAQTKIKWDRHKILSVTKTPSKITESWKNSFKLIEEDPDNGTPGLRKPQTGALHATAAHWSVKSECATIVMPTGTGKTEVMLSALIMNRCEKLVIVIPSASLRDQIFGKFTALGYLQYIKTVPNDIVFPRVAYIKNGIKTVAHAQEILDQSNVIIATAAALSKSADDSLKCLADGSTHLFIDEAHHTPAQTWSRIKELFSKKAILQFTATPFRNDGKKVEGNIIYNYPLGLAQENGYFKEIELIKINEFDEIKADREIATRAVAALEADLSRDWDHIVMVRAKDITRAEALLEVYQEIAPQHNPVLMNHDLKAVERKVVFDQLRSNPRGTRIIVCVNMLGEGYDLPNLKIAAIHDIHKNLTTTLQFIGRFTRTASREKIGNATVVVNTADPKVDKSLEELYSEDPDWNKLLKQKSESAIEKEIKLQEVIQNFKGELSQQVSIWNLRPAFSAFVYKTNCEEWSPSNLEKLLPKKYLRWSSINKSEKIWVCVISKEDEVKWGKYKDIRDLSFELCVIHWDEEGKRLFIHASDYDAFPCGKLAESLCGPDTPIIAGAGLFNLFAEINHPMVRNLGASRTGTISFTMYFGPEVTRGLSEIDKAESIPNNIFAWGYEKGDMVTYGCSAKSGKVWSHGGGSIVDWKDWCSTIRDKIIDSTEVEDGMIPEIVRGFLRPTALNGRHASVAVSAEWGERLLQAPENRAYVFFGNEERSLFEVGLEIASYSDDGSIQIALSSGSLKSEYSISYLEGESAGTCKYEHISGPLISIQKHSGPKTLLDEYMVLDPLIIRYADGSFSYGNFHVKTPVPSSFYDAANIETLPWTADIHVESEGAEKNSRSIQFQVIESIKDDYDIVINDDDSYEAADIIGLRKEGENTYVIHLIHCKFSYTDQPSGSIDNLYQVCGQAQKCVRWKHAGFEALMDHIKRREEKWQESGHTRFRKGDLRELAAFGRFARSAKAKFEVSIYQPGLSKARVGVDITQLLACTENYLVKTSEAKFRIVCSE